MASIDDPGSKTEAAAIAALVDHLRKTPRPNWEGPLGAALLDHGVWLIGTLVALAQRDALAAEVHDRAWDLAVRWLRGRRLSTRADESDLRAGFALHFLEARDASPALEVSCAMALLALPDGHPLRDRVRIERLLRRAARRARQRDEGWVELNALGLLVRHRLLSHRAVLRAVRRALEIPAGGAQAQLRSFLIDAAGYFSRLSAGGEGRPVVRTRRSIRARELVGLAAAAHTGDPEQDKDDALVLALVLDGIGDEAEAASLYERGIAGRELDDPGRREAALRAGVLRARLGQPREAIGALERVVPLLEQSYLESVDPQEVEAEGTRFADASIFLALAHAAIGDWASSFLHLDRAKSLRSRHRAALAAAPEGRRVLDAERRLAALSRGGVPRMGADLTRAGAEVAPRAHLLEELRKARSLAQVRPVAVDVASIGSILPPGQAVAALGVGHLGTEIVVVCPGDAEEPTWASLLPEWPDGRWRELLMGAREDGWIYAICDPDRGIDPRGRLEEVLAAVDEAIGEPVAELLHGRGLRRLTVVPHLWLHFVPFWALTSWADLEVGAEAHGAGLLGPGRVEWSERTCLSVSDPTLDLWTSPAESRAVEDALGGTGWKVRTLSRQEATVARIREAAGEAELLHVAGHAMSDVSDPERSALRMYHDVIGAAAARTDPLGDLARAAVWQTTEPGSKVAEIPGAGILREVSFRLLAERRFESAGGRTLWARYDREHGRVRAAELWTAQDIMQGAALDRCQLAVLSSCQAAQTGLEHIDEYAGLAAALRSAGVVCVVSPLWPVEDTAALLFVDLLARDLASAGPRPDVVASVGRSRRAVRDMTAQAATSRIQQLRAATSDPQARAALGRAAHRLGKGPPLPFSHPYDWAAFAASGPLERPTDEPAEGGR